MKCLIIRLRVSTRIVIYSYTSTCHIFALYSFIFLSLSLEQYPSGFSLRDIRVRVSRFFSPFFHCCRRYMFFFFFLSYSNTLKTHIHILHIYMYVHNGSDEIASPSSDRTFWTTTTKLIAAATTQPGELHKSEKKKKKRGLKSYYEIVLDCNCCTRQG